MANDSDRIKALQETALVKNMNEANVLIRSLRRRITDYEVQLVAMKIELESEQAHARWLEQALERAEQANANVSAPAQALTRRVNERAIV